MMEFYDAFKALSLHETKGIRLPKWQKDVVIRIYDPSIEEDIEKIAESVHNAWCEEKKKQGIANHPDMKPYAELNDNVKEYDRVTARTCLNSMTRMTAPYLYVESRFGKVPWKETMIELFSKDWEII